MRFFEKARAAGYSTVEYHCPYCGGREEALVPQEEDYQFDSMRACQSCRRLYFYVVYPDALVVLHTLPQPERIEETETQEANHGE